MSQPQTQMDWLPPICGSMHCHQIVYSEFRLIGARMIILHLWDKCEIQMARLPYKCCWIYFYRMWHCDKLQLINDKIFRDRQTTIIIHRFWHYKRRKRILDASYILARYIRKKKKKVICMFFFLSMVNVSGKSSMFAIWPSSKLDSIRVFITEFMKSKCNPNRKKR